MVLCGLEKKKECGNTAWDDHSYRLQTICNEEFQCEYAKPFCIVKKKKKKKKNPPPPPPNFFKNNLIWVNKAKIQMETYIARKLLEWVEHVETMEVNDASCHGIIATESKAQENMHMNCH